MTTPNPMSDDLRHRVQHMLDELEAMRGENRVQRHLLHMDMRDRLDELERRHAELHAAVRKASAESVDALRRAIAELREGYLTLRGRADTAPRMTPPPSTSKEH